MTIDFAKFKFFDRSIDYAYYAKGCLIVEMLLKESERHLKGKVVDEEKEQNSEAEMPEFQTVLSIP